MSRPAKTLDQILGKSKLEVVKKFLCETPEAVSDEDVRKIEDEVFNLAERGTDIQRVFAELEARIARLDPTRKQHRTRPAFRYPEYSNPLQGGFKVEEELIAIARSWLITRKQAKGALIQDLFAQLVISLALEY